MKRVIVTGATGFLGFNVVTELLNQGIEVCAVVREGADCSNFPKNPNLTVIHCDLEEISTLPSKINKQGFDVFYHFAWSGTSGSDRGNYQLQLNNVKHICEAVKVATQLKCAKFVNAGSIMEYEVFLESNNHNGSIGLNNIYGAAKLSARLMGEAFAQKEGIPFISAIISNIYGEGERSVRFIISILKKLINNERISCTSGEQLYDFIHIQDASKAFILLGKCGEDLNKYYIGSKTPKPLKSFIKTMRDIVSPSTDIGFGEVPFKGTGLSYNEFDTQSLYNKLGFEQKISFEEGIKRTADWLKSTQARTVNIVKPLVQSNFTFTKCNLGDATIITPFYREDTRGFFLKNFERNIYEQNGLDCNIYEDFYSYSKRGVTRGLHFQHKKPQAKLVSAISGNIFDVIVDLRPNSKTFGKWESFYLSNKNRKILYVPKGFAHGFQVISDDAIVSYKCIEPFIGEYDGGIIWNDEILNIDWPIKDPDLLTISDKDSALPSFRSLDWHKVFPNI